MELKDQAAVVTGATRGIGRAIALELASLGANIILNYHSNSMEANKLVEEIEALGVRAISVQGNVAHKETADLLIATCLDEFGKIDILVNNAGITKDTLLMRMKDEDWDEVIATNLKSVFYLARAAIKPMMKKRYGRIINISSVVGLTGNPGQTNYAAAKAGLIGMTKSIAKEVAARNILVNAIAPGYIETDMTKTLPEEIKAKVLENIPLGRMGTPEDIANVVSFLASPKAAYITGQTMVIDGGMVMQ